MSLSTTLGLVKALKPAGSQATTRKGIQQASVQQPITWAGSQQPSRTLEAVLLIVNQDVEGPNDPRMESLFRSLHLQGRLCAEWIDEQTTVHIVVRAYAADPRSSRALGQPMFRRLLDDQFDEARMTSATFNNDCGGAGIIIAQWRSESQAAAITTDGPQSVQVTERPTYAHSQSDVDETHSMGHWSWWAERELSKGSCV
jgi:hypothetical protein